MRLGLSGVQSIGIPSDVDPKALPTISTQLCSSDVSPWSHFGQIANVESWSSHFTAHRMTDQGLFMICAMDWDDSGTERKAPNVIPTMILQKWSHSMLGHLALGANGWERLLV